MIIRRVPVFALVLCFALGLFAQTQDRGDAQIIEEDRLVTTVEGRERAVASLLNRVTELRNAGQVVEAARALNRAGGFQVRLFVAPEAVKTFQEALKLLEQQPDNQTRIDSLNGLAASYNSLSKCELAESHANQAITLSEQNHYVAGQAEALRILSDCQNFRDHALALKSAQESLALWSSIARKRGMADAHVVIGHYEMTQNNLAECAASMDAALGLYRELNDLSEQAEVLIYLAYIEYRKGAWQNTLAYYSQAQAMIDEKAEPYKMGQIAIGLGDVFLETGMPDLALPKYREALEDFRITKNQRAVSILKWSIGKAYYYAGQYQEALDNLQTARGEAEANKDTTLTAFCDDYLGRTYHAANDYSAALSHFQAALDGFAKAKNTMEIGRTRALIGRVYQQQGNQLNARKEYESALATFRTVDDHVNESATLYAMGTLALQQNNLDLAQDLLQQSIKVTEDIRRPSTSSDLMTAFSAKLYERYEAFIECLMRKHSSAPGLGLNVTAFETHELARARALTELLRATQTNLVTGLDPGVANRERTLRQSLRVKEDAKVKLLSTAYKSEDLLRLDAELAKLRAEYKEINSTIAASFPAYDRITQPGKMTLQQIQQQVLTDDNTLLLEYALGTNKSYVWAITRAGFSSYELPGRSQIERAAQDLYASLIARQPKPDDTPAKLQARIRDAETKLPAQIAALSNVLLGPVAGKLEHQRLLIVPDGLLQYIPFQALTRPAKEGTADEARPLVLDHEIINEPSASALAIVLSESVNRKLASGSVTVLADPVFEVDDPRLPSVNKTSLVATQQSSAPEVSRAFRDVLIEGGQIPRLLSSREEAEAIMSIVPWRTGSKAVDFQANREKFLETDFSRYRIVHFATHALLDNEHPELSGIVLSLVDQKGKPQNGFLRLNDIYNLRLPVDLVVLSACQTGLGKDVKGEGLIGLTRGFMYAGAGGVVASLWKVDDDATAELMTHFYEGMFQRGLTPAAALREAQLTLWRQKNWHSSYYWAAFVLQGQYNQQLNARSGLSPSQRVAVLSILLTGLGLGVFFLWRRRRTRVL